MNLYSRHPDSAHDGPPKCNCGSGLYPERVYDAQGIYLTRACDKCRKEKLSHYRPEILSGYNQADVDEPIEPEDY